jgi:hypothetical protein
MTSDLPLRLSANLNNLGVDPRLITISIGDTRGSIYHKTLRFFNCNYFQLCSIPQLLWSLNFIQVRQSDQTDALYTHERNHTAILFIKRVISNEK